jgi:hypothetical protein
VDGGDVAARRWPIAVDGEERLRCRRAQRQYRVWDGDRERWTHYRPRPDFAFEKTWWQERHRDNVHPVHYNDLRWDPDRAIQRLAAFLGIELSDALLAEMVEAATFASMR